MKTTAPPNHTGNAADLYIGCHGALDGFGGAAILAKELAAHATNHRLAVRLFGMGTSPPAQGATPNGITAVHVSTQATSLLWRFHLWNLPRLLAARLREFSPPATAFVSFSPFWTIAARIAWPNTPLIVRFCGILSNCLPFTRDPGVVRSLGQRFRDLATRHIERRAMRLADVILVPTEDHAAEIRAFAPRATPNIKTCLEGCTRFVDAPADRAAIRHDLRLDDSDTLLLAVGSFDRNKAFDYAVQEMAATTNRTHLALIGDGPQQGAVQALVDKSPARHRIHLVRRQRELAPWYAAADCIVSTSHYDTCPNVVKEALCVGRPAILPRHDPPNVFAGTSGRLEREGLAVLYDRRQPGDLANRINTFAADRSTRDRLKDHCRSTAPHLLTWEDTLRHVLATADSQLGTVPTAPDAGLAQRETA